MNAYYYRLVKVGGSRRTGIVHLAMERDFSARLWLEKHYDAPVVSLRRLPGWLGQGLRHVSRSGARRIRSEELAGMLRDLAVMTAAGIPMIDALQTVAGEEAIDRRSRVAAVARLLLQDLDGGASVSDTFARHHDIFPETVRNLVTIGDETGSRDTMLMEAAEHIERLGQLGRDTRRAMIYPAVVFAAIFAVALFWAYYVIPNLADLFRNLNASLPPFTLAVLAGADWLGRNIIPSLVVLVLAAVGLWLALRNHRGFRHGCHRLAHRIPVIRQIVRASGMAFFTEHFALLIRAGLDARSSLEILARSTRDEFYRSRIERMRQHVERGELLASAMRQIGGFPPMAVRMIAVGEDTGTLEKQLRHLAREYRLRLDHLIGSLSEIIKPAVILVAGALFLLLVIAFLLPVYDLVRQAVAGPVY